MKTNRTASKIVRIRGIAMSLALVGMVGISFCLGGSLAARFGQPTAPQTQVPQVPSVSLADLFAAAQ